MIVIFSPWSKCIFSHFKTDLSIHWSNPPGVLRKKCSENMQRTPMQKCISTKSHATLLKSYFGMGILLWIFWIFSANLFIKSHPEDCFWIQRDFKGLSYLFAEFLTSWKRDQFIYNLNHEIILLETKKTNLIFKLLDKKLCIFYVQKLLSHTTNQ